MAAPDRRRAEVEEKTARIRARMETLGLDAVLLRKVSSFAWATAGASSFINTAVDVGEAALLITRDARAVITNNIEELRLREEEGLAALGWDFIVSPWFAPAGRDVLTREMSVGSDLPGAGQADVSQEIARFRAALVPDEIARFEALCRSCADAMGEAIAATAPGKTEHAIAAFLAHALLDKAVWPIVIQVAFDARAFAYRHALPTDARLDRYAMVSFCGRRHGLVCSMTRSVYFGSLPFDLRRRELAVARVDAAMLRAAVPGARLGGVFETAASAYASAGFDEEWRAHHQGGLAGYEPREFLAMPSSEEVLIPGHVVAFNPTIRGTKSEDTARVTERGADVLTEMFGWPTMEIEARGRLYKRPRILIIR